MHLRRVHARRLQALSGQREQVHLPVTGARRHERCFGRRIVADEGVVDLLADLVVGRSGGGPSQARSCAGGVCMAATVASSMPSARPRQPAWAAPTSLPSAAANTTGRQSAVRIASTTPGTEVTAASTTGSLAPGTGGALKRSTVLLCTWRSQCGADGSANPCCSSWRLCSTLAGYHHRPRAGCPG